MRLTGGGRVRLHVELIGAQAFSVATTTATATALKTIGTMRKVAPIDFAHLVVFDTAEIVTQRVRNTFAGRVEQQLPVEQPLEVAIAHQGIHLQRQRTATVEEGREDVERQLGDVVRVENQMDARFQRREHTRLEGRCLQIVVADQHLERSLGVADALGQVESCLAEVADLVVVNVQQLQGLECRKGIVANRFDAILREDQLGQVRLPTSKGVLGNGAQARFGDPKTGQTGEAIEPGEHVHAVVLVPAEVDILLDLDHLGSVERRLERQRLDGLKVLILLDVNLFEANTAENVAVDAQLAHVRVAQPKLLKVDAQPMCVEVVAQPGEDGLQLHLRLDVRAIDEIIGTGAGRNQIRWARTMARPGGRHQADDQYHQQ